MTQEQQDKLRRALYNAKFTTDAHDENPFVGVYFNDLLDIIEDYVEQPLIDKACEYFTHMKDCDFYEDKEAQKKAVDDFIDRFRKAMQ